MEIKVSMLTHMIVRIVWNTFKSILKAVKCYPSVKRLFTTTWSGGNFPNINLYEKADVKNLKY